MGMLINMACSMANSMTKYPAPSSRMYEEFCLNKDSLFEIEYLEMVENIEVE
jgi:hypothetical protein